MKNKFIICVSISVLVVISVITFLILQKQTIINAKNQEIHQLKNKSKTLETQLNQANQKLHRENKTLEELQVQLDRMRDEFGEREKTISKLLADPTRNTTPYLDDLYVSKVTINGKKPSTNRVLTDPRSPRGGLYLDAFCDIICKDMKLEIVEYAKREHWKISEHLIPPLRFTVSYKGKTLEFTGIAYDSPMTTEPMAQYIAGRFGDIRPMFIRGISFNDHNSLRNFLDYFDIEYTFIDDGIDFHLPS